MSKKDCDHIWRYRMDELEKSWEEGCVPAICIKCGELSCACEYFNKDFKSDEEFIEAKNIFFSEGIRYDSNLNK